jgi:hypothetical protein
MGIKVRVTIGTGLTVLPCFVLVRGRDRSICYGVSNGGHDILSSGHLLESLPARDGAEGTAHVDVDDLQAVDVGGVDPAESMCE